MLRCGGLALTTALFALCSASGQAPKEPFTPDPATFFLAHFDGSAEPDVARGGRELEGNASLIDQGLFAGALHIQSRRGVSYPGADGNFPVGQGTIEMWVRPAWDGGDGKVRRLFGCRGVDSNFININKLATNKFGVGIAGQAKGQPLVYSRPDVDVSHWRAGEWRHVAVCWTSGSVALWLDGKLAREGKKDGLAPRMAPRSFILGGDPCDVDEFRISSVVRYGPNAWQPGDPVPAQPPPTASARWEFNEPKGVYAYDSPPADRAPGFRVAAKSYLDDMESDTALDFAAEPALRVAAAPGEYEPAAFVLVATRPLRDLRVSVVGLPNHVSATVRRVVRTPMRRLYTCKRDDVGIVGRFLPRWQPLAIPAGEFREVWLEFHVAADAPAASHSAAVEVAAQSGAQRIPLALRVRPFKLVDHPTKHLGTYYRMSNRFMTFSRLRRELADMRSHGCRSMVSHLDIEYVLEDGRVVHDFGTVRDGLRLLAEAGFDGTIVVGTGFRRLAGLLKHRDLGLKQTGESLDDDPRFWDAARAAMEELVRVDHEFPELRVAATHMDEVFNNSRLALYIRLTKATRQVPQVRAYITFHTVHDGTEAMRREIDPYADIRCNHGYSFEWWLGRGHTIAEYEAELKTSGDQAWMYHNARGVHFTAEWSRIINGVYLWASPFRVHVPWTYQSYQSNPFDDTDGKVTRGHDFGMSFPGRDDPADLVPTRVWEAMREGGDDIRYIATLEAAIAKDGRVKPAAAAAATRYLAGLKSLIRSAEVADAGASPTPAGRAAAGEIDLDTGLVMGEGKVGSAEEAPLIHALATRYTGAQWQAVRERLAEHITKLTGE